MQTFLIIFTYSISTLALFVLAWRDPRRIQSARGHEKVKPLSKLTRTVLLLLVFAPLVYAIQRSDAQDALVAGGGVFVIGWVFTVRFKVQR